ncbi:MAG: glycosyltransferase family 4 protein [Crocinitomix sp.]|nr:glycosyltransferase family 4 protein [Crocinitomix sp.]
MSHSEEKRDKILMVFVLYATFAKRDVKILEEKYEVVSYRFNTSSKYLLPIAFIKQFFYLLFNMRKYTAIITQSSGYLSYLPSVFSRIFKKRLVIIAIGTDCARLPEINYGSHDKTLIAWFTRYTFNHSDLILPVHKSLTESTYTYMDVKYPAQGIRAFCPKIKTPIIEMVNGYDTVKWKLKQLDRKPNTFLTVTFAVDRVGYYRKGIDTIITAAKAFPYYEFTVVGKVNLMEECPANITLISNVPQEELLEIYNSHTYYMQLSMFEGFPNALCEAMLCGCIPIGSDVAAIPDIIDDCGYILTKKTPEHIVDLFGNLNREINPENVRNRIKDNFPLERRAKEFLDHMSTD